MISTLITLTAVFLLFVNCSTASSLLQHRKLHSADQHNSQLTDEEFVHTNSLADEQLSNGQPEYSWSSDGFDYDDIYDAASSADNSAGEFAIDTALMQPNKQYHHSTDSYSSHSGHQLTAEQLAAIESARRQQRLNPVNLHDKSKQYGKVCRVCQRPNLRSQLQCKNCLFTLSNDDLVQLPDNPFLAIIDGSDVSVQVVYRDDTAIVMKSKHPIAAYSIKSIPTQVIPDVTHLTRQHVPLIQHLYTIGLNVMKAGHIPWFDERFVSAGFNYPVVVHHLHLHMIMPPFNHENIFTPSRWIPYEKVLRDLKLNGRVRLYNEYSANEAKEGEMDYKRAMHNWKEVNQIIQQQS